jgi:hypothetical protein
MMARHLRLNLEKFVLGSIIIDNCFSEIEGVLSSKNFSVWEFKDAFPSHLDFKTVFEAMAQMYHSQKPIDSLTLSVYLHSNFPETSGIEAVSEAVKNIGGSSNLSFYAMCLLEDDIKIIVESEIRKFKGYDENEVIKAAFNECIKSLNEKNDFISLIHSIPNYLKLLGLKDQDFDTLSNLSHSLAEKILILKKKSEVRTSFSHLKKYVLNNFNDDQEKEALIHFLKVGEAMLQKKQVDAMQRFTIMDLKEY